MGTQKNRLNKTVLLGTHNTMFKLIDKKLMKLLLKKVCLTGPTLDDSDVFSFNPFMDIGRFRFTLLVIPFYSFRESDRF